MSPAADSRKHALRKRARELLDGLSVLLEEFCLPPQVHTAVETGNWSHALNRNYAHCPHGNSCGGKIVL